MSLSKNELIEINSLLQQDNDLLLTHISALIRANAQLVESNKGLEKRWQQANAYNKQLRGWIDRTNQRLNGQV